jgi:hypothetical protein
LVTDLTDIVGLYTDEKTYNNLNNLEPEIFTKKKLIKNMLEQIPLDHLTLFSRPYNLMNIWMSSNNIGKIDVSQLLCIFVRLVKLYGNLEYETLINQKVYVCLDSISGISTIKECINKNYVLTDKDVRDNMILKIANNDISISLKEKFLTLFGNLVFVGSYFSEQVLILMELDLNFHPFSNLNEYKDKLSQMVLEKLDLKINKRFNRN